MIQKLVEVFVSRGATKTFLCGFFIVQL